MTLAVLHICNSYVPRVGGLEQHIRHLTKGLQPLGVESHVLTPRHHRDHPARQVLNGVHVRRVGLGHFPDRVAPVFTDGFLLAQWLLAIQRARPDLVHIHGPFSPVFRLPRGSYVLPASVARRLGWLRCPIVVTYHGVFLDYPVDPYDRDRKHVRIGSHFIGVDRSICARLTDALGVPREQITFISNGVDTASFQPGEKDEGLLRQIGLQPTDQVILVPRRVDPKNGIEYAIQSLVTVSRTLPRAKMLILGFNLDTSVSYYAQRMVALIRDLGLQNRIICHPGVPPEAMPAMYRLADVTVVPSLWEATSLAALESLASGVPVVASRVGGLPDLVDEENGALVPPRDPDSLAAAVVRLLTDDDWRRRLARKAVERARKFDWSEVARATLAVYRQTLEAEPNPQR